MVIWPHAIKMPFPKSFFKIRRKSKFQDGFSLDFVEYFRRFLNIAGFVPYPWRDRRGDPGGRPKRANVGIGPYKDAAVIRYIL